MLSNGQPALFIIQIRDHFPIDGKPYFSKCSIECFLSTRHDRIGFLFFQIIGSQVWIEDIFVDPFCRRQGIGSLMMAFLEAVAIGFNAREIVGRLAAVDFDVRDVQIAFYKAQGFTVKCNDEQCETGSIRKSLQTPSSS